MWGLGLGGGEGCSLQAENFMSETWSLPRLATHGPRTHGPRMHSIYAFLGTSAPKPIKSEHITVGVPKFVLSTKS